MSLSPQRLVQIKNVISNAIVALRNASFINTIVTIDSVEQLEPSQRIRVKGSFRVGATVARNSQIGSFEAILDAGLNVININLNPKSSN